MVLPKPGIDGRSQVVSAHRRACVNGQHSHGKTKLIGRYGLASLIPKETNGDMNIIVKSIWNDKINETNICFAWCTDVRLGV